MKKIKYILLIVLLVAVPLQVFGAEGSGIIKNIQNPNPETDVSSVLEKLSSFVFNERTLGTLISVVDENINIIKEQTDSGATPEEALNTFFSLAPQSITKMFSLWETDNYLELDGANQNTDIDTEAMPDDMNSIVQNTNNVDMDGMIEHLRTIIDSVHPASE